MGPEVLSATLPQSPGIETVGEFFAAGGFLMWPILGCSVVVVGLAIERYLSVRHGRVLPSAVEEAVEDIVAGRAEEGAEKIAGADAPAANILNAGLRRRGFPLPDVEKAMEDQAAKEASRLRGNVRGIGLMAAVSPLLGLLGTVLGIAEAFATVEQTGLGSASGSESLAAGIKVALYTTIFGLFVAIPATLIAAHLHGKVRRVLIAIGETLSPAIVHLAARPAAPPAPGAEREKVHAA